MLFNLFKYSPQFSMSNDLLFSVWFIPLPRNFEFLCFFETHKRCVKDMILLMMCRLFRSLSLVLILKATHSTTIAPKALHESSVITHFPCHSDDLIRSETRKRKIVNRTKSTFLFAAPIWHWFLESKQTVCQLSRVEELRNSENGKFDVNILTRI